MRKEQILILISSLLISLFFIACGNKSDQPVEDNNLEDKAEEVVMEETEKVEDSVDLDYENMTAEDLLKDIKDIQDITVDEFLTLIESYKYVKMDEYFVREENITDEAFKILKEKEAIYPDTSEIIEKGLQSPVAVVRAEVLNHMVSVLGINDENVEKVLGITKTEEDPYVLYKLTNVTGHRMKKPEIADFIFKMSNHENPAVRTEAVRAISSKWSEGVDGSVERTIELMEDENIDVRKTAYKNAGSLADDRVIEPLVKALMDPEQSVFHDACMTSLTQLWIDFPSHENTSEKAYEATIDYLKFTPRSELVPNFAAISQVQTSKTEGEKFDEWKQKAFYYNPNDLVEPMFDILKDSNIDWIAGTTAMKVVKSYGTQEQFDSLKGIIESSEHPNQNLILDAYNQELEKE